MKTILDNFSRLITRNDGPGIARQMHRLATAQQCGILSTFELAQIKTAVSVMTK